MQEWLRESGHHATRLRQGLVQARRDRDRYALQVCGRSADGRRLQTAATGEGKGKDEDQDEGEGEGEGKGEGGARVRAIDGGHMCTT